MKGEPRGVLAAVLAFALGVGLYSTPPARGEKRGKRGCPVVGQVTRKGNWTVMRVPRPPSTTYEDTLERSGQDEIDAYAVAPNNSNRIVVAQRRRLLLTTDGGCHWKKVFKGSDQVDDTDSWDWARITDVQFAPSSSRRAYALLSGDSPDDSSQMARLLASKDGGKTWKFSSEILLLATDETPPRARGGDLYGLVVTPKGPRATGDTLYLSASGTHRFARGTTTNFYPPRLYASEDGGKTWQLRYVGAGQEGRLDDAPRPSSWNPRSLGVDPLNPRDLWLNASWSVGTERGNDLFHSTDGGRTWGTSHPVELSGFGGVNVTHSAGSPARILVHPGGFSGEDKLFLSNDGGKTWRTIPKPPDEFKSFPFEMVREPGANTALADVYIVGRGSDQYTVYQLDMRTGKYLDLHPPQEVKVYSGQEEVEVSKLKISRDSVFVAGTSGSSDPPPDRAPFLQQWRFRR